MQPLQSLQLIQTWAADNAEYPKTALVQNDNPGQ
jgi:hypothetical protein